ncbi:MAG TPA: prepilin-type N-terminal cleavage/methylation domain-containing protein [Rickettsiales bacterium]|nr:prepilin-type N-terminal cleavage/methylation domain-containing protein [Rickettsiales bacterium]
MLIKERQHGFTLIEVSIVLVVIGLLVGAVVAGRSLIDSAGERAQITQINKYQTAVHAFQLKYRYLPGDIPSTPASMNGFAARGSATGQGDGNGLIEGDYTGTWANDQGTFMGTGEIPIFWADLTVAGLIDATIYSYDQKGAGYPSTTQIPPQITLTSSPSISDWLPTGKIGNNTFVYVHSHNSTNYFGVSTVTKLRTYVASASDPGISVQQAASIDSKIDDGLPMTGAVTACYQNSFVYSGEAAFAAGKNLAGADAGWDVNFQRCNPTTAATPYATTNCFDNNNVGGGTQQYSTSKNGAILNCALSFEFQ